MSSLSEGYRVGDLVEVVNFNLSQNGCKGVITDIDFPDRELPIKVVFTIYDNKHCRRGWNVYNKYHLRKISEPADISHLFI